MMSLPPDWPTLQDVYRQRAGTDQYRRRAGTLGQGRADGPYLVTRLRWRAERRARRLNDVAEGRWEVVALRGRFAVVATRAVVGDA
jgi:hypothetical protein